MRAHRAGVDDRRIQHGLVGDDDHDFIDHDCIDHDGRADDTDHDDHSLPGGARDDPYG